jgi:hypothetical protein
MVNVEESRLNGARVRLAAARVSLIAYSMAKLGFGPRAAAVLAVPKSDEYDIAEK